MKEQQAKPLTVQIFGAKPNKLFAPDGHLWVRFLRYSASVACAECGRRSKHHWTALWSFKAKTVPKQAFTLTDSGKIHMPLTPVCRDHPIGPEVMTK